MTSEVYRRWIARIAFVFVTTLAAPVLGDEGEVLAQTTEHVQVSVNPQLVHVDGVADPVMIVQFMIQEGWHLYWINPGESGLAPTVSVQGALFECVGETLFPCPTVLRGENEVSFGYERALILYVPVRRKTGSAPNAMSSSSQINVGWLVCKEKCIAGKATLTAQLLDPVVGAPPLSDAGLGNDLSQRTMVSVVTQQSAFLRVEVQGWMGDASPQIVVDVPLGITTTTAGPFATSIEGDRLVALIPMTFRAADFVEGSSVRAAILGSTEFSGCGGRFSAVVKVVPPPIMLP
ncbi:MAG: protein-disulfide reductase DsbD family protein [Planctomycetota bacterium]|nr:protein-disulfide reductase DsbD family protein [Planctomycetota bacterium]